MVIVVLVVLVVVIVEVLFVVGKRSSGSVGGSRSSVGSGSVGTEAFCIGYSGPEYLPPQPSTRGFSPPQ